MMIELVASSAWMREGAAAPPHAGAADRARRHVQSFDERAQQRDAPRVVRAQQDAVGAPIRHHRETIAARSDLTGRHAGHPGCGDPGSRQAHHQLSEVDGGGVLNRDHRDVRARRLVDPLDDAQQPPHVVRIVGDDERVGRIVYGELAGRRHQRPQHVLQLRHRDVLPDHDVRDDLLAAARGSVLLVHRRRGLRFGDRNDAHRVARTLDRGEALRLQRGEKDLVPGRDRHRPRRDDGDLSPHARVDQHVAPRHLRHRLDHGLQVCALEIEHHLARSRGDGNPRRARSRRGGHRRSGLDGRRARRDGGRARGEGRRAWGLGRLP